MGLFLFALVWLLQGSPSFMVLAAVLMIYVQLLAIIGVTIFFSTLGSAILASVLGICVFVAGQLSHNVLALTRLGTIRYRGPLVGDLRAHPQPHRGRRESRGRGRADARWGDSWVGYLLAYIVVVLALATCLFRRKEF